MSPDAKWVLSASQSIKLWDAKSHELKSVFTGHASPVLSLSFVPKPTSSGDYYFLSTAKGDRYINVWYSFYFTKTMKSIKLSFMTNKQCVTQNPSIVPGHSAKVKVRKVQLLQWFWRVSLLDPFRCTVNKMVELSVLLQLLKMEGFRCFLTS